VLTSLFDAPDLESRMRLLDENADAEEVAAYFSASPEPALLKSSTYIGGGVTVGDEFRTYTFQATTNRYPAATGVTVLSDNDGQKILWGPFYEFQTQAFDRFMNSGEEEETLHMLARKTHRLGSVAEALPENLSLLRLTVPSGSVQILALIDVGDPVLASTVEQLAWTPRPVVARLHRAMLSEIRPLLEREPDEPIFMVVELETGWADGLIAQ